LSGQALPPKPRLSPIKEVQSNPEKSKKKLKITLFLEVVRQSNREGGGK
jgi:hypothetical protein